MNKQKRWSVIVKLCQDNEKVEIATLVNALQVSEATVRRDLQQMEDLHMILRYHGGAKLNLEQTAEPPMLFKAETNSVSKNKVARLAAQFIKDNQMVYIDAGSTTYEMLNYITAKNITVVTIGIPHIERLGLHATRTIALGGNVRWSTQAITGVQTLKQLENMYFDVAFIGVNGIHKSLGFTTTNEQEAEVKAKVIRQSTVAYLLADSSKFNKLFPAKYASLDEGILIADDIPNFDRQQMTYLLTNGETNLK